MVGPQHGEDDVGQYPNPAAEHTRQRFQELEARLLAAQEERDESERQSNEMRVRRDNCAKNLHAAQEERDEAQDHAGNVIGKLQAAAYRVTELESERDRFLGTLRIIAEQGTGSDQRLAKEVVGALATQHGGEDG